MSYQFIYKQFGNWKLYIFTIILWLVTRDYLMQISKQYIPDFNNRLVFSLIVTIILSLILIYYYEKYIDLEHFNTTYPRDEKTISIFCNESCKKISDLNERIKCESKCKEINNKL